jgi:uncharacterized protein (TIGR00255 family)
VNNPPAMRSMTGYGRGEAVVAGGKVTAELSSVNRRQSEISLALPREFEPLESRVRELIHREVSRGRVTARVTLHLSEKAMEGRGRVNVGAARAHARELRALAKELRLGGELTLETLLRVPGVLQSTDMAEEGEAWWPAVERAFGRALAALVKARQREGAHLGRELRHRIRRMRAGVGRVARCAPGVLERYREQLRERVKQAGIEMPAADDERVLKELVYFSDRSDITEELTRLRSHFAQFDVYLRSKEPAGRPLDFLAQEMNRELNTIGSKANDSRISREVVGLKTELEKFREQVQNVE